MDTKTKPVFMLKPNRDVAVTRLAGGHVVEWPITRAEPYHYEQDMEARHRQRGPWMQVTYSYTEFDVDGNEIGKETQPVLLRANEQIVVKA